MEGTAASSSKRLKTDHSVHHHSLKINDTYIQHADQLNEAFCSQKPFKLENTAEVITNPFTCCILPDFIQPDDYLKELRDELMELDMERKINDLYQFNQSKDLGDCSSPQISLFKKLLSGKIYEWIKTVTNLPLIEKNDIFCSHYSFTDHLLCHDDELEGRRIAYIFYLVPEWNNADGGCLDLFNIVDGQPSDICKTIVPKWNNFVFFEVSPISYHQVSEVLTSKTRIALSGWFYGPPLLAPSVPIKETIRFQEPSEAKIDVTEWINPIYLQGETQLDINESFEDSSEISLNDFLVTEKYEEVCKALMKSNNWKKLGPPNLKNVYEAKDNSEFPPILRECQSFFTSEAFLLILSNFTSLKLHPTCDEGAKLGKVASYIRKWCRGSYTLLHDQSFSSLSALHAFMHFNCHEWDSECGGYISFIANEENEELLRIDPSPNTLSLVYTTEGTSHFVKYINSSSEKLQSSIFYDIYSVYLEESDVNDDNSENE